MAGTSWFAACKTCSRCGCQLKTGMSRYSCKNCKYHLCASCHTAAAEEWNKAEITITIYRAAQAGVEEDALQVSIERSANISSLRNCIGVLYGIPPLMQILRRDLDSQPLADDEQIGCDEGDVLHLTMATPADLMMGAMADPLGMAQGMAQGMGMPPLAGLAEAVNEAMNEVAAVNQAMQQSLESTTYNLTFVMLANGRMPEKRCRLEISAAAQVEEVLDMVKLELNAEDVVEGLEFAGQELPRQAPIYGLGIREGDVLMVRGRPEELTSI